ncbi:phage tail tape measure protein [Streptomyces mirabilis]|uniref:phage tail tape measure protein n=1 Tax=Streptomyces mirabilis TaxID=68239 RepID=UPI0021C126D3|nr:phage tail tape measure protein [Streptomyces mirabilis]MCT9107934.1 phage tail tape measure protein [Streptomyces mirabilis]
MALSSTGIRYDLIARDSASRTFAKVGRSASTTEKIFGKLGKAAVLAGTAVATGLAAGLAKGAKDAARFQSEMTRISTQAGGTAKDVKVLSDQVLKLGTTTQQGPQHLAESLYHLKSVGMDNVSAMKALKESSDLAAVGHANLEATTNALAGAWRTGIKGATSFHEAVSTVNAIIGAGNMSMDQFNAAIGTGILPSAKTFGLSMKQVGAALALMTDEGIDSASAATRLRMSFSLLGAPSGAAEKQLKKIGLTGLNLADAMRGPNGLIGALTLLKEHLDKSGMSASQQSQLLSRAFGGGRSSSGILLMLNNLDVLQKKQDQINRSTGKFDDAVKMQRKTAEAQWALLTSNLEVMGIRVGTKVLPPVTDFIHFLATDAMPAASKFGQAVRDIVPTGAIKKGFSEAKGLVSDFFGGLGGQKAPSLPAPMLKAPSVPKALALPAVPKSDAAQLGGQIHTAIQGGIDGIKWGKLGETLGKGLGDAIGWVGKHTADFTKKIAKIFAGLDFVQIGKSFGATAIPLAIGFISSLFDPLFSLDFWKKHWLDTIIAVVSVIPIGRLAGGLAKVFEHIPFLKVFEPLLKGVGKLGGWIEKGLGKVFGPIGRGIARGFKDAFPAAEGIARDLLERFVMGPVRRLRTAAGLIPRAVGSGIESASAWLTKKILDFTKLIVRPFARAGSWLLGKGTDLARGFGSGVARGGRAIGSFAKKWVIDPVVGGFSRAGSWLLSKGRALVSGFKSGVTKVASGIGGWTFNHILVPIANWMARSGRWLISKGSSLVSGFKSGVSKVASGIGGWLWRNVGKPAVDAFKGAGSWIYSSGKSLISGLVSGTWDWLKGKGNSFLTWAGKIKSKIIAAVVDVFKIGSPSKVMMEYGGHIMSGLWHGMLQGKDALKSIAATLFASPLDAAKNMFKNGASLGKEWLGKVGGAIGLGNPGATGSAQQFAQAAMKSYGWGPSEWPALKALWNGESGWDPGATNASSGAYGIPQALPASKMASAGSDWKTNAATQIRWGLGYIKSVYGSPNNAWSKWQARSPHWYAAGTGGAAKGLAWVGERGAELVNFKGGEDVLSHRDSMAFAKANAIKLPGYASGTITNAADRVRRDKQRLEDAKDAVARAKRRHKGVQAAETRLRAAQKELQAANIALKNAQRSAKTSISNTIATGLLKTLSTGTSSAIASAIKSLATKLLNAGYNRTAASVQKKGGQLEKLADRRASVQKTIDAANAYASDQASKITDFLSISGTSATDIGSLISQMGGQQKTASSFVGLSKSLKARGASKALLQQLSDAGPGSQLATILGQRNVTTQDISKLNSLISSGGKLATSFGRDMADLMYDTGKHAGEGFLAGLKATEKDLQRQIDKLAKNLVDSIKKALKIKSPSIVMRDEVGKNVVLGWVAGMDMHSHLVGGAAQRLADTASGVSVRRRYVPTAASSSSAREDALWDRLATALENREASEIHVHFNDDRLRDLIDVRVKPKVQASANTQAYRAKVGRRST